MPVMACLLLLASCQKEFNEAVTKVQVVPVIPDVSAIVITNGTAGDYDSVVYRYFTGKTNEIHYNYTRDSVTRTYYYDAAGRLSKLEDQKAIYYTNNDVAKRISFIYNNAGEIVETLTDFNTLQGIKAWYNDTVSGDTKTITIYDTAYRGPSYDLDWANRVIYTIVNNNNSIVYDSCIYYNYIYGHVKTIASSYDYNGGNNATSVTKFTYQDFNLAETGITYITRDKPAPFFEALRKKLFRNLLEIGRKLPLGIRYFQAIF